MICRNCACKNEDDSIFCKECGTRLEKDSNKANFTDGKEDTEQVADIKSDSQSQINQSQIKKVPKKFIAIGVLISIVLVLLFSFKKMKPTINLDKYVEVSYNGYDGYGKASIHIDWTAIENKYWDKLKYTDAGMLNYGRFAAPIDVIKDYISVPSLNKKDKLKNGEELIYKWDINEKELKQYIKCKIKYSNKNLKVEGLEEIATFDPFENFTLKFNGIDSKGKLEWDYEGKYFKGYEFSVDKDSNLSNGDKIKVSINADNEYLAKEFGKIPAITEKEYTVEGLATYLAKASEINEENLKEAKAKAEADIENYIRRMSKNIRVSSVTYLGNYVALTDNEYMNNRNYLGLVFRIDSRYQVENEAAVDVVQYYDLVFKDVAIKADGTLLINLNSSNGPSNSFSKTVYQGSSWWNTRSYQYEGYETLQDLIDRRTADFGTRYNYDWNIEGFSSKAKTEDNIESTESTVANTTDYICSYSAEREITREEITAYMNTDYSNYGFPGDRSITQMIINEMYARHGYQFNADDLNQYFSQKQWYASITSKTNDMDSIYQAMSDVEKANITLLKEYK